MKLIGSLTSPYTRKVRIVLAEKKIDFDFEIDSPWTPETHVPDFNPLGKVPVLVLDDGLSLFDSRVIVEYLDNVAPNNKLMPAPSRERTLIKRWEALADGLADAAVTVVMEGRRAKGEKSPAWIERHMQKVTRTLDFLERELGENAWTMGTHFSMADVAVGTALGYLAFRLPQVEWQKTHPKLAALYEKVMQRPSFSETIPRD